MSGSLLSPPARSLPHLRRLRLALADLEDDGRRTPCQNDPEAFTGTASAALGVNTGRAREGVAALCHGCPVVALCDGYAEAAGEQWHIWGGKVRGRKPERVAGAEAATTGDSLSA